MMGGVIGTQAWLSLAFVKKQRISLLNDVNHTVAETGAMQLNATFLLAAETARAKALGALFASAQTIHPASAPATETHLLGLQVFRKDGEHFVEEKLPADVNSLGYTSEVIGSFLTQAEKDRRSYWQAANTGTAPRFFLATRIDAQATDHPVVYVAVAEIDPQLLVERLQSASLFDTFLITKAGQVLFHLGGASKTVTKEETASVSDLMKGRGPASSGLVTYKANGKEWYGAVAPVHASDFYFLSRAGSDELSAELSPLIQIALALGAVALVASLLSSYIFKVFANRFLATYAGAEPGPLAEITKAESHMETAVASSVSSPLPAEIEVPPPSHLPEPPPEEIPVIHDPIDDMTKSGFILNEEEHDQVTQLGALTDHVAKIEKPPHEVPLVDEDEDLRRVDE